MADYDVVVVGGGHNGLTAAARLAQAGKRVGLFERREILGGVAAGESFHPGYSHTGLLHDSSTVRPWLISQLGLEVELRDPPPLYVADPEGPGLLLPDEVDPQAWAAWRAAIDQVRAFALTLLERPPPKVGAEPEIWSLVKSALSLRRLGPQQMLELFRVGATCADDWVAEYFDDPAVRASLVAPALRGAWMGPRSPSSTANLLLYEVMSGQEVKGGPAALAQALISKCEALGVVLHTGARVERIELGEDDQVTGVTVGGEAVLTPRVVACCDVRHALLDLVDPALLPRPVEIDVLTVRSRGTFAKVHLALEGPLPLARAGTWERVRTGQHPNAHERAFDDVKYRRLPLHPPLDMRIPTVSSPALAPAGHHVVSVAVDCAAIDLEGGWDTEREALYARLLGELESVAPGVSERIVAHETLTPLDIETRYGSRHIFHAEHALDQLFVSRPILLLSRYETPLGGLFLGASGSHPGGRITCLPGWLAAEKLLQVG